MSYRCLIYLYLYLALHLCLIGTFYIYLFQLSHMFIYLLALICTSCIYYLFWKNVSFYVIFYKKIFVFMYDFLSYFCTRIEVNYWLLSSMTACVIVFAIFLSFLNQTKTVRLKKLVQGCEPAIICHCNHFWHETGIRLCAFSLTHFFRLISFNL